MGRLMHPRGCSLQGSSALPAARSAAASRAPTVLQRVASGAHAASAPYLTSHAAHPHTMALFPFVLVILMVAHGAAAHPHAPRPGSVSFPRLGFGNGTGDTLASRVIGGTPVAWKASAGMHAKLTINGDTHFVCGGSLVTFRHVLTAAHCVSSGGVPYPPTSYHVRLGGVDVDHGVVRAVSSIAIHPEYAVGRASHADVAVLTLDREVGRAEVRAHHLRTVKLNPDASKPVPGSTAVMSGWGHASEEGGPIVDKLLRVRLRVLSHAECLRVHGGGGLSRQASAAAPPPQPVDEAEELCTGGDGRRSCTGVCSLLVPCPACFSVS